MPDIESTEDCENTVNSKILDIVESEGCDVYCFIGELDENSDNDVISSIYESKKHKAAKIFITTPGGSAHTAYRIGRALQESYDTVTFVIPDYCKSAGTLLACCADILAIDFRGELGPLDVQLHNHNEPGMRMSGLDTIAALDQLTKKVIDYSTEQYINFRFGGRLPSHQAVQVSAQTVTSVFAPIYAQLDPIKLGEVSRSLSIAKKYGERLNRGNVKKNTIDRLVEGYPCHDFVIDYQECSNLFNNVRRLTQNESVILKLLWTDLHRMYEDKVTNREHGPVWIHLNSIFHSLVDEESTDAMLDVDAAEQNPAESTED